MRVNRFFLLGAIALGLVACNKNNDDPAPPAGGRAYVGVQIAFPGMEGRSTRSLEDDYNPNGEWKGRDKITSITVYMVNETTGTVDHTTFDEEQFEGITADGYLKPKLAAKATAGHSVAAYAVINDFSNKTGDALKTIGAAGFAEEFAKLEVEATTRDVSRFEPSADGDAGRDVIMMTNRAHASKIVVEPGVTEAQAISGEKNQAKINVSRVVSRGIATIGSGVKDRKIPVKNANGAAVSNLTLKTVTYAVAQGNKKFFNMIDSEDLKTPEPVYSYIPNEGNNWAEDNVMFDYTDANDGKDLQDIADKTTPNVVTALTAEEFGKFVLPVTHKSAGYKKGNTTYFEIRCTFVPDKMDGTAYTGEPSTVFLGMNDGQFYSTRELAVANGQKATQFKDGVMKYVLWLNPNKPYGGTQKITESPTARNQIYHAHITGFKEIGVPYNPIHPDDPDNPNDPDNPDNPIHPDDPLQNEDTHISVSIAVLAWGIHSYDVDLGNDY